MPLAFWAVSASFDQKLWSKFQMQNTKMQANIRVAPIRHSRRCKWVVRASGNGKPAPNWNPQNVESPQTMPTPELSPEQCVQVQLDALLNNDSPWPNHGLQTLYEFGEDIGGLDPSFYFGFRKDLYHFDHFMGQFQSKLPHLMDMQSYSISSITPISDDQTEVLVDVNTRLGLSVPYRFVLKVKDIGRKKGSWMTKSLVQVFTA